MRITPDNINLLKELKEGQQILYTGNLIVMRDAAQKRIKNMLEQGKKLPVDLKDTLVFYAGPTFVGNITIIGPTTSTRMDKFLEMLFNLGVLATVGKGKRSKEAEIICKKYGRPYLVAPSGCAAYLSTKIISSNLIAFEDLGAEGIYELIVQDFPIIVIISAK